MSTRAKWIVALALLIIAGLWLTVLIQLRPLVSDEALEVRHVAG